MTSYGGDDAFNELCLMSNRVQIYEVTSWSLPRRVYYNIISKEHAR
jgi:hypothetical protein